MKIRIATILLLVLATVKVVADVAGWKKLSAVAAVTNTTPAMKVFTAHDGYETFSSTFTLTVFWIDGHQQTLTLNPANYRGLQGPYNRRNVYWCCHCLRANPVDLGTHSRHVAVGCTIRFLFSQWCHQ